MIYQKIQKNEKDPKVKKAKGLALFLAYDKGRCHNFKLFFSLHVKYLGIRLNEENLMVPLSLCKMHGKVTSAAKYCIFDLALC